MSAAEPMVIHARPDKGWCSRRLGDNYAPNEHDGSYQHARTETCVNFEVTR